MKRLYLYMLLSCAVLWSSCNDWLDVRPQAQVESDDLYKNAKGFEDALTACYIKLKSPSLYGVNLTMTVTEYLAQHWEHESANYRDEEKLKNFDYTTQYAEDVFISIYSEMYNTIAQANSILENMPVHGEVIQDEALRHLIEAEALSIRAFCHTDVLRLFGQMPRNATRSVQLPYAKTVSTAMVPYYSYTEFVSLILEDIEAAQALFETCDPLMDYNYIESERFQSTGYEHVGIEDLFLGFRRFRFNYYALEALKARLYCYTGNKELARMAANNVIQARNKAGDAMISLAGTEDFNSKYYALPTECLLALSDNELEDNTGSLFSYRGLYLTPTHYNELFNGQSTDINNRAIYVWILQKNSQGTELRNFRKYLQPKSEDVSDETSLDLRYHVIPLIRLSEMYLIAMENAASVEEANGLYKTYMEARNVAVKDLTSAELSEEILKEYRREFFGEGQMFYVYKRLGIKKMLWKTDREVEEKDYIVPLPSSELGV